MNDHLNDGQLRAALDEELGLTERQHLESCATCQARKNVLKARVQRTARPLYFLADSQNDHDLPAQPALLHFYQDKLTQKETPMLKKLFASTTLRIGFAILLILALIISIPSTRALAGRLLELFRVQQVTVIPVDFTGLQQLTDVNGKQISELISDSITMTQKPGDPVEASDAADASAKAGFTVRLPKDMTPSRLSVTNRAAFDFTIDRTKAQALLDEAGRSDLVLPDAIDGTVISVSIPASVQSSYGTCPDPAADDSNGGGSPGRRYPDCVILAEIPSPTVSAPPEVDVAQLAQIGLEFTGMTSDQAAAFTQSVDWTSTLVVPIPKNAATYEQVTVDGVTGTLIQRPADDAPQYVLLWVKDGIVYSIGGLGANSQQAIDMANSLQ
jgi:hypothetical protein